MGTVQELSKSKGRYRLFVGSGPQRQSRTVYADGKRHAAQLLREWEDELRSGGQKPVSRSDRTLDELVTAWIAQHPCRDLTRRGYEVSARRIPARHQATKITALDYSQLADLEQELSETFAPASVRQTHAVLRGAFRWAVLQGWLRVSPIVDVRPPKRDDVEIVPPSMDLVRKLTEEAGKWPDPTVPLAVRLALATGLRRAELVGLQWADVVGDELRVRRTICEMKGGGWQIEPTKTARSARVVALDADTVEALRTHRAWQDGIRASLDVPPLEWIVGDPWMSKPWLPNRLGKAWTAIRNAVPGAEHVRLHDVRHWHATMLVDMGVPRATIIARLGHSSGLMLDRVYAHRTDRADREASAGIGKLLG
jgi:integrase